MDRFNIENAILEFTSIIQDYEWAVNNEANADTYAMLTEYMKFKYDQLWDTFIKEFKLDKYSDSVNRR